MSGVRKRGWQHKGVRVFALESICGHVSYDPWGPSAGIFTLKNVFYVERKAPAALGPASKNAVFTFKIDFTVKNAFIEENKNACGIRPSLKKRSECKNAFYTQKRIL